MSVQTTTFGAGACRAPKPVTSPSRAALNPSRRIPKAERWLRLAQPPSRTAPKPAVTIDDEALIEAVVRGDTRRADELHDRLISVIEPTLYRVLGRRERDHDDLVQATF